MKKILIILGLGLALLVGAGCGGSKYKEPMPPDYNKIAPLVIIGGKSCLSIEYAISEWIDENSDGKMQESELYTYVTDILEPGTRREYYLPHGYYAIRIIVKMRNGEILEAWAEGPIPDPALKPNEKVTLTIGCGKDFSKNGKNIKCPETTMGRSGRNAKVPGL